MNNDLTWPLMGETITFKDRLKMAYFAMTAEKFTNGKKVKQFEEEWNKWLGSKYSLFVSSGSTANFLLVAAVKDLYNLKAGDKVLVPACTWVTNVGPIMQLGLVPVFCDINLYNFSFDLGHAKSIAKDHPDIKLIFVTHLLGLPGENSELRRIFPDALIIDDVCESHGCTEKPGKKIGSDSLGATYSFYFGHHMSTVEGGMVSTNNPQLYDIMKMKRSHGLARESIYFKDYAMQHSTIDKQFLFITDGYNFRNHELPAVLGSSQLERLDNMIAIRKRNYKMFTDIIDKYPDLFYTIRYDDNNSSFCFPFVCRSKIIMEKMKFAFIRNGIEYRPIVSGNLLKQPFLRNYRLERNAPGIIDIVHEQGVYIGNNHFVSVRDMEFLDKVCGEINAG
jgi:CDP-6-deoxy-D-xylo-4-hexulose-3-dehydrase